ncbi:interleukin-31 receptor subunit alpha [Chaetodon auriga]|uniref:interleukin-31 receptor subunit alpha n=1 Tax=Chaetodon auriga TaxID=39042 RepID=UPI00403298F8
MEQKPALVWTCLLGAGLVLVLSPPFSMTNPNTVPRPPRLIACVFLNRANVTCRWEAGDTPATHYTLQVERIPARAEPSATNSPLNMFTCTTSETSCTAISNSSVRFLFCITVTAHSQSRDVSSQRRCQSGRTEGEVAVLLICSLLFPSYFSLSLFVLSFSVMLPPVSLNNVKPVRGRPRCLNITWTGTLGSFPVSYSEIKGGNLISQIEFAAQGQFNAQVENVTVRDNSFLACLFRPDTLYTIKLRHSFRSSQSPWSPWSNASRGRTGEDAPSAAPALWRRVKQTDKNGWRLVSLLWKPLPRHLANGKVLFFSVNCQTENAQVLRDRGSCTDLTNTSTSCSLRLPAGRCSCALTASTSEGASPEARIWFLGAFETEPPPPSQISVSPLDDSSLDVRWTAPVDQSTNGFLVEWFAVREQNSSILHWERLNRSCTALVITEGVQPMERYVVSVKALYGERGAGQSRTVNIYTREGVPSAGPKVQVQQISGSTVELTWSPVPVELLHGFIRTYTVCYSTGSQPTKRVLVPGNTHRYSLSDLLPGNYDIFLQASTDAGAGTAGPITNVHIGEGSEEISVLMYTLLTLVLTTLALVLMACLVQSKMVKQKLCQDVPDPSNSSLAHWTPKTALESMKQPAMAEKTEIKYSAVILLDESKLPNSNPDKDLAYQSVCNLQTYSSHRYSPLPVSSTQTPQNTRNSEKKSIKISTRAKTASNTDLSSFPSIYSNILVSQTLKRVPPPLLSPSYLQTNDWQHSTVSINDAKIHPGRDGELSLQGRSATTSASQTDELETFGHFLRQHQSPASSSDLGSISHSSVLLFHPAAVTSPQHSFSHVLYSSVPSLQPDTVTRPDALSGTSNTSLSPFPHSVFVDLSYCPLQCDP